MDGKTDKKRRYTSLKAAVIGSTMLAGILAADHYNVTDKILNTYAEARIAATVAYFEAKDGIVDYFTRDSGERAKDLDDKLEDGETIRYHEEIMGMMNRVYGALDEAQKKEYVMGVIDSLDSEKKIEMLRYASFDLEESDRVGLEKEVKRMHRGLFGFPEAQIQKDSISMDLVKGYIDTTSIKNKVEMIDYITKTLK